MSNLYAHAVPVVISKLSNLKHIVQQGAEHAKTNELTESALTAFRLYPDMLDFAAQIRIATDLAAGMTHRLTGNERLSLDDNANRFAELLTRLEQTIEHLKAESPDDYDGSAEREVHIKTPFGEINFSGNDYLTHFLFPNLYFHIVTPYNMLRHNGVKLGKMDFMRGASS